MKKSPFSDASENLEIVEALAAFRRAIQRRDVIGAAAAYNALLSAGVPTAAETALNEIWFTQSSDQHTIQVALLWLATAENFIKLEE